MNDPHTFLITHGVSKHAPFVVKYIHTAYTEHNSIKLITRMLCNCILLVGTYPFKNISVMYTYVKKERDYLIICLRSVYTSIVFVW